MFWFFRKKKKEDNKAPKNIPQKKKVASQKAKKTKAPLRQAPKTPVKQGAKPPVKQTKVAEKSVPPAKVAQKLPTMCPICEDESMGNIVYSGKNIAKCEMCSGSWIPKGQLDHIAKNPEGQINRIMMVKLKALLKSRVNEETKEPTVHKCPVCSGVMMTVRYKKVIGVTYEQCEKNCGDFIDKTTLEKIQALEKLGV